jgi:aminoglycoside phosphotransferase (APT) family kinase protein
MAAAVVAPADRSRDRAAAGGHVTPHLKAHFARLFPGAEIVAIEPLAPDTGARAGATEKAVGYGLPVRVVLVEPDGRRRELVWRTASANEFGHDRRSDRAAGIVQSYEDFAAMPSHVEPIDVGFVAADHTLRSIRDTGEPYLITSFAPGTIYADDLRRIATERTAHDLDLVRVEALARYLAALHVPIADGAVRYRRAIRDLVGSGEGIYGIVDGYPDGVVPDRLRALEEQCAEWRWRLRGRHERLTRTHGDFHPFNIVFAGTTPTLLDASRGGCGDPADDLTALAVNFLLFAIDDAAAWPHGLGVLWRRWWADYLALRDDPELLAIAPPYFAWRTLVVCNPRFYPKLSARGRDRLLGFAEDVLATHALDPVWAEELFR